MWESEVRVCVILTCGFFCLCLLSLCLCLCLCHLCHSTFPHANIIHPLLLGLYLDCTYLHLDCTWHRLTPPYCNCCMVWTDNNREKFSPIDTRMRVGPNVHEAMKTWFEECIRWRKMCLLWLQLWNPFVDFTWIFLIIPEFFSKPLFIR